MADNEIDKLYKEIEYLKQILKDNHIKYDDFKDLDIDDSFNICNINKNQGTDIIFKEITNDDVRMFYSYFKGRNDVYARRFVSKNGKAGYSWQCNNLWSSICPKSNGGSFSCNKCKFKNYKQWTGNDLMDHLKGLRNDDKDIIGLYPLLKDNTCNFLVFDFDDHDLNESNESDDTWMYEINALRCICKKENIPCLVERSRSGKGGHLWIFFEEAIDAGVARDFGDRLLNSGIEYVNLKNFKYFDRILPAQSTLPIDKDGNIGLGNLIALPLQGRALRKGNSAFVDENFNVYKDQFEVLKNTKKLSKSIVESYVADKEAINENEESSELKPWIKKRRVLKEDVNGCLDITLANRIYIDTRNIKPRSQNALRLLASFGNPVYFKNKALGYSNFKVERFIYAGYDDGHFICLPRGLLEVIINNLDEEKIGYSINDLRQNGRSIKASFNGELYVEQKEAIEALENRNMGIIVAATAFGKTVIGSYLINERKVNTLILVHNKEIMYNWIDGLKKFLTIDEELPVYKTKSGRDKKCKDIIGSLYSGHNSLTGIVDVALFSSFGDDEENNNLLENYGMVIMDECHHGAAESVGKVLDRVKAKYVYGLTATPKRDDGKEKLVYMYFGPIRYKYTARQHLAKQNIPHYICPRFTRLVVPGKTTTNELNDRIVESDSRNELVIEDILKCVEKGRTPLVLTKYRKHAEILYNALKDKVDKLFLLESGLGKKDKEAQRENLYSVSDDESLVIVAIDKYVGEGFNYPRLDTLFLTMPIKWEGKVEQCAGRLHRDYKNKKDVIIYDYVDMHIPMLERMYQARIKTYHKIGYEVLNESNDNEIICGSNFLDASNYLDVINKDILNSKHEVIISSTSLSINRVYSFIALIKDKQHEGVKFKVITLSLDKYDDLYKTAISKSINELEMNGVEVIQKDSVYKRFMIIDNSVVYYGTINILAKVKEDDSMIRINDNTLANELLID